MQAVHYRIGMPDLMFRYNPKAIRGREIKAITDDVFASFSEILDAPVDDLALQRIKAKGTHLMDLDVIVWDSSHKSAPDRYGISDRDWADAAELLVPALRTILDVNGLSVPHLSGNRDVTGVQQIGLRTARSLGRFASESRPEAPTLALELELPSPKFEGPSKFEGPRFEGPSL